MGFVDFFTKNKKGNRNYLSDSDEDIDDYIDDDDYSYARSTTRRKSRSKSSAWKKQQKRKRTRSKVSNRSKKRFNNDSLGSSSSISSFDDEDDDEDDEGALSSIPSSLLLTREELFELPVRELRKKCRKLQLDTSGIVEKAGLVELLHGYYKQQSRLQGNGIGGGGVIGNIKVNPRMSHLHPQQNHHQPQQHITIDNEADQMVEILQEIIPYFGQGDLSIDSIVKDTIMKLPIYCLDNNRDQSGNTLLILCCQAGTAASELIQLMLSRGSDPNCQNAFGETCLHYTCYNDSYAPENAKVRIYKALQVFSYLQWTDSLQTIPLPLDSVSDSYT